MSETMEKSEWLENFHHQERRLAAVARNLHELAQAFSVTGNETVAEQLYNASDVLMEIRGDIGGSVGEMLTERLDGAREMWHKVGAAGLTLALELADARGNQRREGGSNDES